MSTTSVSLLDRIRAGDDPPAWQRLIDLYTPLIRHVLRSQQVFQQDADDLVQEVMQVLVRKVPEFAHNGRIGAFRHWLRTITINCISDYYRVRRNQPLPTGDSDLQKALADLADQNGSVSRMWDAEHDRLLTRRLLEILRPSFEEKTWQAFQGFTLEGRSAKDVAAELEITPNAVFIAKSRVLARLRQEMAELIDEN